MSDVEFKTIPLSFLHQESTMGSTAARAVKVSSNGQYVKT